MASGKKSTAPNPILKTYGERPVPFQFPGSQEKMYIGSEVCHSRVHSLESYLVRRLEIISVYFVEHSTRNIRHYGVE